MLVELKSLILEFETAVLFRDLLDWTPPLPGWNETHHAMAVMPGRRILKKFPRNRSNCSQHDAPVEHFRVTGFVQLLRFQTEHGIDISDLELRNHPSVELKFRCRVFSRSRVM